MNALYATRVAAVLSALSFCASAAEPTAASLVAAMRESRQSEGFEIRMQVVSVAPDGQRSTPIKLAVIGEVGTSGQRLLLRGISPDAVRGRRMAVERSADGRVRAADPDGPANPYAPVFDTGLVAWDMLMPWWEWPRQSLGGTERIGGRECRIVRSRNDAEDAAIREVVSCVDADNGLSLRTQFFDARHGLVRSIAVLATIARESGRLAAKKLAVTSGNGVTEAEVYSGDEHYRIPAGTFSLPEARPAAGR